jgi:Ser/Thr protein kinase RdoA (MazF antagonist)
MVQPRSGLLMDPKIAAIFNDFILHVAMQRYGIAPEKITLLDSFESFIYEFERPDGRFILRIGHSSRRSPGLIHGEVDWINYLADSGVTVARAIISTAGNLVELIDDGCGGQFLCTAFVRAPGGVIKPPRLNDLFFRAYGRLLGQMHALARVYVPSSPAWNRYAWNDPINLTAERQMPVGDHLALENYCQNFAHLLSLPCDPSGYGMIHQDAHPGNFFVDEDYTITLFDFDDCVYGHFIYDIAMVIFYVSLQEKEPAIFLSRFLPVFFTGYKEENRIDPVWLKEIPYFLKFREIDLFAAIQFAFGENPLDPWCARYMQSRRSRIENNVPFLDFDWESLARYL